MTAVRISVMCAVTAIALGAIAVWPLYARSAANAARTASLPAPAPVTPDYRERDRLIAFWEGASAQHRRGDMLTPSMLSAQYLQRFRERGDFGDVLRSLDAAKRSLRAQPYGNVAAETALGSALLALHRFSDALAVTRDLERLRPGDPTMRIREASLDLELGRYADARRIVASLAPSAGRGGTAIALDTLLTRYDELTGHLRRARERFERTAAYANAQYDAGAQERAWFLVRAGELAFEAGDGDEAIADERRALRAFPDYSEANRMLARVACAQRDWETCLGAARASAAVVPYPEVLGYEVDAQRSLGDAAGARQTDALIRTIARIGNAEHVSDRLLAAYFADHRENAHEAYRIARRELAVRDDVFTDDALAWAAAMDGRWEEARARSERALRLGTESSLLLYHAGVIAMHAGVGDAARRRLTQALALNPHFHPFYADDARARLARL